MSRVISKASREYSEEEKEEILEGAKSEKFNEHKYGAKVKTRQEIIDELTVKLNDSVLIQKQLEKTLQRVMMSHTDEIAYHQRKVNILGLIIVFLLVSYFISYIFP